jgi:putative ABC transport system permease protein
LPQAPESLATTGLVVRTRGDPAPAIRWLRTALGDTAFGARNPGVIAMTEKLAPDFSSWQLGAQLLGGLGALGLVIAALGLYSVISYLVTRRTRELAVRIAIGARASNVVRHVLGSALRLVAIGLVVGLGLAVAGARFVSSLLYQTSPGDPMTLASAAGLLIATSCIAVLVPVWRALRIDPLIALREE